MDGQTDGVQHLMRSPILGTAVQKRGVRTEAIGHASFIPYSIKY